MAERTDQRTRDDVSVDVDTDFGSVMGSDEQSAATDADSGGGIRSRLSQTVGGFFSIQTFLITLVLTVVLALVAGAIIPIIPGSVSGLLGVFVAGFALGVGSDERHYLEVGAATLLAGAVTALLSHFTLAFLGNGMPLVAFGAGASGLAGLVGHYFGRDLRSGVTQDI